MYHLIMILKPTFLWNNFFLSIIRFSNVDVSVAVATPTGLITPILHNADSRGIIDLSKNMKQLAQKAKDGKLQPQEYQGGTVTVSNLGMYGMYSLSTFSCVNIWHLVLDGVLTIIKIIENNSHTLSVVWSCDA